MILVWYVFLSEFIYLSSSDLYFIKLITDNNLIKCNGIFYIIQITNKCLISTNSANFDPFYDDYHSNYHLDIDNINNMEWSPIPQNDFLFDTDCQTQFYSTFDFI